MFQRWTRILSTLMALCILASTMLVSSIEQAFSTKRSHESPDLPHLMMIIPKNSSTDELTLSITQAAQRYGASVEVYQAATKEEELRLLDIAVDAQVDGIMLAPLDSSGYDPHLYRCQVKGIGVVVVSTTLESPYVDTFIGASDSSQRMALFSCINAVQNQGVIMVFDRLESSDTLYIEAATFTFTPSTYEGPRPLTQLASLVDTPPEGLYLQDITTVQERDNTVYDVYSSVYKLLAEHRPSGVFSYNSDITAAIAACYQNTSAPLVPYVVGYGTMHECQDAVQNQIIDGLVLPNDNLSYTLAVRYLLELHKNNTMPATADSGISIITHQHLNLGGGAS